MYFDHELVDNRGFRLGPFHVVAFREGDPRNKVGL